MDRQPSDRDEFGEVWHDVPVSFDPLVHHPRIVKRTTIEVTVGTASFTRTPAPPRPRANYRNREYTEIRVQRLTRDANLCVFCKSAAATVHHASYRHAGGQERTDDLRSLCRLCHDAVTMIEYEIGMGLDRIDPCSPQWRESIIDKRSEIIGHRSLGTRRRRLKPEEVE